MSIEIETYYSVLWYNTELNSWANARRVPQCPTIEEALCYLDLIHMGRWRKNDPNSPKEFLDPTHSYKIVKFTITQEEVHV
jgi:hypothetical protein